jgi:Family of unknown function (DUF6338)
VFGTLTAVVATTVFLLPGFVVADLTQRQRAASSALGDQRAILRALFFSVAIHVAVSYWTWTLAQKVDDPGWTNHYGAVVAYVVVVVVVMPVALGLLLNDVLIQAERGDGQLRRWHYALGARDARDAWDYTFQRYHDTGVWVLVHLKDTPPDGGARVVIGKYGRGAAAGQSPVPEHDLLLRELWLADENGVAVRAYDPPRSMWVAKSEIAELYLLEQPGPDAPSRPPGAASDRPRADG